MSKSKYSFDDDEDEELVSSKHRVTSSWWKDTGDEGSPKGRQSGGLLRRKRGNHNKRNVRNERRKEVVEKETSLAMDMYVDDDEREPAYEAEPALTPVERKEAEDRGPSLIDIASELVFRVIERAIAAVAFEVFQFFSKRRFLTPRERRVRYSV